jgi:hypothetical protein
MNIKITENLVLGGRNGWPKTRSRVIEVADDLPIPRGAVKTDEAVRDWKNDFDTPVSVPVSAELPEEAQE